MNGLASRAFKHNARVQWADGMRPIAHPHEKGWVFMSTRRETYVVWDGTDKPQLIATIALTKES